MLLPIIFGLFGLATAQNFITTETSGFNTTETLALRCITQSGPRSPARVPTTTQTPALTTEIISNLTTTPTITVTPSLVVDTSVVNVTLTNTETSLRSTNVLTITSVQSFTSVATMTATNFTTSNITVTQYLTTSATIAPSSGFVPIQSIIRLSDSIPGKRDEIHARAKRPQAQMVVQDDGTITVEPRQYPVRVQCLKVIFVTIIRFRAVAAAAETITASAQRTTTVLTSTFTANATAIQADATEVVTVSGVTTVSSVTTVSQLATVVSTTTQTIYSSYPTLYYAACGPENIARTIDQIPIGRVGVKNTFGTLNANTPYDCCVRGIQGQYAGTFFQKGACFLISQAVPVVCDPQEQAFTFNAVSTLDASDGVVLSNGNCGQGQLILEPLRPGFVPALGQ